MRILFFPLIILFLQIKGDFSPFILIDEKFCSTNFLIESEISDTEKTELFKLKFVGIYKFYVIFLEIKTILEIKI